MGGGVFVLRIKTHVRRIHIYNTGNSIALENFRRFHLRPNNCSELCRWLIARNARQVEVAHTPSKQPKESFPAFFVMYGPNCVSVRFASVDTYRYFRLDQLLTIQFNQASRAFVIENVCNCNRRSAFIVARFFFWTEFDLFENRSFGSGKLEMKEYAILLFAVIIREKKPAKHCKCG